MYSIPTTIASLFVVIIGLLSFFNPNWEPIFSIILIWLISIFYFIYYLFDTGEIWTIAGGIIFTVVLISLCSTIPVIGWFAIIGFFIYNISKSLDNIKNLLPDACWSAFIFFLLFAVDIFEIKNGSIYKLAIMLAFVITINLLSYKISEENLTPKSAFMRFAIVFLSIPLICLSLMAIFSSLRNLLNFHLSPQVIQTRTPQQVSGYIKQDGTIVDSYTRNVTQTTTQTALDISAGSGSVSANIVKNVSNINDNITNNTEENKATDENYIISPSNNINIPETNPEYSFYRYDNLNNNKINNFIEKCEMLDNFYVVKKEDIIVYFDETVFGKGDTGIVITHDMLVCTITSFVQPFYIYLKDIEYLEYSKVVNFAIYIHLKGVKLEIILTQSNKGAKQLYDVLEQYVELYHKNT